MGTPPRDRRLRLHAFTALALGGACSVATAPFAAGSACTTDWVAWVLVACSTLLSVLPVLPSALGRMSDASAAVATFVLSAFTGALNAIVVFTVSGLLSGNFRAHDLPLVAVFSIPFGGIPGGAYGLVLALGTWLVRKRLAAPVSALDAGRASLLLIAVIAVAANLIVFAWWASVDPTSPARFQDPSVLWASFRPHWPAWPFLVAVDVAAAVACIVTALHHAATALRVASLASDRTGSIAITEAATGTFVDGLPHVVAGGQRLEVPVLIVRRALVESSAAYRGSTATTPVMSLATSPRRAARSLWTGVVLFALLGAALGYCAFEGAQHAVVVVDCSP